MSKLEDHCHERLSDGMVNPVIGEDMSKIFLTLIGNIPTVFLVAGFSK
jgi:hypothetical protein